MWTDERIATLRQMRGEGKSLREIAAFLGVTRNACSGKCDRLGILGSKPHFAAIVKSPKKQSAPRMRKPSEVPSSSPRLAFTNHRRLKIDKAPAAYQMPPEPSMDYAVTLFDLEADQCHWPIGDPSDFDTFRYCGAPNVGDVRPYCLHHRLLQCEPAYRAGLARRLANLKPSQPMMCQAAE